jgi:hypothetical protein
MQITDTFATPRPHHPAAQPAAPVAPKKDDREREAAFDADGDERWSAQPCTD